MNHMLTKRKLYKHELDEAITVLEKAVSDLKSLKEYHYGDV